MIAILLSYTVTSREFVYTNSVSAGNTHRKRKSSVHNGQIRYEHSIWYGQQDLNLHGCPLEPKGDVTLVKVLE